MTTVAEVMTRDLATIGPSQSLREAAKMMDDLNVGSLPVCDGVNLIGMLTDRDIVVRAVSAGVAPNERIEGVVSGPPDWCYEDDDVDTVRKKMEEAQIRRVPVVDREKRLVGILSLGDLATAADGGMPSTLGAVSAPSRPDR
ncbi:CBS domain-containing protein [Paraburkholderia phymatum]|uniref:CBS domain containing protein n=1 Tax=Paraburkholderia phymatum (strain DSM 17167 / CIP 108236 / LMG 21445 / STM815) TaxID=391038 RepID=B2JRV0_PARP8|nr:CBS domain-containing protein [Paraburkholderia phymatum]ACC73869.1 CBS domain containing protein [Paraburkholderia phymatum STM815]